jgi:hypothetical protein
MLILKWTAGSGRCWIEFTWQPEFMLNLRACFFENNIVYMISKEDFKWILIQNDDFEKPKMKFAF